MKQAWQYVVGEQVVAGMGVAQRRGEVVEVFNNPDNHYVMVQWPGLKGASHEYYLDIRPA